MAKLTIGAKSDQCAVYTATGVNVGQVQRDDAGHQTVSIPFTYTNNTGGTLAAGTIIELCRVGRGRILPQTCISTSALGASTVLNLGLQEYTDNNYTVVASAIAQLISAYSTVTASATDVRTSGASTVIRGSGVVIKGQSALLAQITGAVIPAGATISGVLVVNKH
jgi:hypothetical protein